MSTIAAISFDHGLLDCRTVTDTVLPKKRVHIYIHITEVLMADIVHTTYLYHVPSS